MAWVAVHKNGSEYISENIPDKCGVWWFSMKDDEDVGIELPKGTIKKLIGRELTFDDNPEELK